MATQSSTDGPATIEEALRFLRIGKSLFWELVGAGRIRLIRIGEKPLVPRAELQRIASEGTPAPRQKRKRNGRATVATA